MRKGRGRPNQRISAERGEAARLTKWDLLTFERIRE